MKAATNLTVVSTIPVTEETSPASIGTSLAPTFQVQLRRRHDDKAPVETIRVPARTIASARHAARLLHPETVILSVKRL